MLRALDYLKVPGALMSHSTTGHGVGSGQVRKAFHFLAITPLLIAVEALYFKLILLEVTTSIILYKDNYYKYLKHVDD